jgi:putative phosphoribosyl transferase
MLAGKLAAYSGRHDVIVLGLPRGGVPVAAAVASALKLPLDVFVVTKIGTPWEQEVAMGAMTEGGVRVLDLSLINFLGISEEEIQEVAAAARRELESHINSYRCGRPPLDLKGRTVILVDDGIATGCSILAAIAAARREGAARVVVAVPVAPAAGCSAIQMEADEFVSVEQPEMFLAVSRWYSDFTQVSDDEVQGLLQKAGTPMARAA